MATKQLRFLLLAITLFICSLYCYACRHCMTSDGMSYLDMAKGFLSGHSIYLLNGIWSPLYPVVLSFILFIFKPIPYNEFAICTLANFFTFLFSLFAFNLLLDEALIYLKNLSGRKTNKIFLSDHWLILLSYILFIQTIIILITLWGPSPDILLSAFIYLAFWILFKIKNKTDNWITYILFGFILGLGYLTKAPMFIFSFIFLIAALVMKKDFKSSIFKIMLSFLVFSLISFPYIYQFSKLKGHLTFGESGKINYAWYVNNIPVFVHWQGGTVDNPDSNQYGKPIHPSKIIYKKPTVYEFNNSTFGTYPPWFDPSYFYEGVKPHFDLFGNIAVFSSNLGIFFDIFFRKHISFIFGFILLLYFLYKENTLFESIKQNYFLFIPSCLALLMYSLVHVETRYIGAFILIIYLGLMLSIQLEKNENNIFLLKNTALTIFISFSLLTTCTITREIYNWFLKGSRHLEWEIASDLEKHGVQRGDKIATIGYKIPESPYWTSVLGVKIISEITEQDAKDFWASNKIVKEEIFNKLKNLGVKVVVAKLAPKNCLRDGWVKIAGKDKPIPKGYFLHSYEQTVADVTYAYFLNN